MQVKFRPGMVEFPPMGQVIALGLAAVLATGALWLLFRNGLLLGTFLAFASAWVWVLWAHNEYSPVDGCPWGGPGPTEGDPVLVAVGLCVGSAVIMTATRWKRDWRPLAVAFGALVGAFGALLILVGAFFVAGSLHCTG
jgi:hypothetical protein